MEMKLVGSRGLGIHNEWSDWDYAILDLEEGGTFHHIINEKLDTRKHCYHYNKEYMDKVARYEDVGDADWQFIFNPENYRAGLIDINPFQYRDAWIKNLKEIDFYHIFWFSPIRRVPNKRVYHIVYNLECLKEGTIDISEEALERVKQWHNGNVSFDDYTALIEAIKSL